MKRLIAIIGVMLLSSAIFFVAVGAGADTVTKPLKAMYRGIDYSLGSCSDGRVLALTVGKGVATEIGESDLLAMYCMDCSGYPVCHSTGWMIITGANGDAIHIEIPDATLHLDTGEFSEEEDIVGGTGRFMDATGYVETSGKLVLPADADLFPFGAAIPPSLIQEPLFWVTTSDGYITY